MKKRMRFLAVAALSLAMTTAFGQQGSSGTQSTQSGSSGQYQNKSGTQSQGVQSTQPGTSTQSGQGMNQTQSGQSGKSSTVTSTQSGRSTQSGQGMGTPEERINSEVAWMKTQFKLDQEKERKVREVLQKYEGQGVTGQGASVAKNQEEKDKELKAIIGESDFQVYKKHEAEMKSGSKGTYEKSSSTKSTTNKSTTKTPDKSKK